MASTAQTTPVANGKPRKPNTFGRPNYNLIHKYPLPVTVEPLPPLIPHNPLSILTILWVWLRSTFWRPTARVVFTGTFSPETRSVHITDDKAVRALWEMGFFGKGTLSRSEPTWLDREKRKKGLLASETSEEVTRKRRLERKRFKEERAQKAREEIEAKLEQERGNTVSGVATTEQQASEGISNEAALQLGDIDAAGKGFTEMQVSDKTDPRDLGSIEFDDDHIENLEHLQLTLEEAFFLAYALGVLQVTLPSSIDGGEPELVPRTSLFPLFRAYSTFPPSVPVSPTISPSDTFVANYAVYHHFRSLGWVIRPGPKFAVDWMLYNRGPPFSHAEFAVITVPSYSHGFWKTAEGRSLIENTGTKAEGKSWHWLHMVNRVQSQVKKTLVLAFVEMPPPLNNTVEGSLDDEESESPTSVFRRMKVREIIIRRWVPNRNRD